MRRIGAALLLGACATAALIGVCVYRCGGAEALADDREKETAAERDARVHKEAEGLLKKMRADLGKGFHYRVVRCFAVAGDVSERRFNVLCAHTVGAAYDAYEKQFFSKTPDRACRVFLFKDRASYLAHCRKLFDSEPGTPFGYYSHAERALVMNIGTGGGTLVHEMFHALVEPDFPDIPAWANEGIASLFEQCRIADGKLIGFTNWRLAGLQKALAADTCPTLRKVMSLSDAGFHSRDAGIHYAVARYFMLYLQEKGLLEKFYTTFRDTFEKDKTGITVAEALLEQKLEDFEPTWREWVKGLRFP